MKLYNIGGSFGETRSVGVNAPSLRWCALVAGSLASVRCSGARVLVRGPSRRARQSAAASHARRIVHFSPQYQRILNITAPSPAALRAAYRSTFRLCRISSCLSVEVAPSSLGLAPRRFLFAPSTGSRGSVCCCDSRGTFVLSVLVRAVTPVGRRRPRAL